LWRWLVEFFWGVVGSTKTLADGEPTFQIDRLVLTWINLANVRSKEMANGSQGRSLVISPHVDDEVLGCGGILDDQCFVYYCGIDESQWNKKNDIVDPERRIAVERRYEELKAVAGFLGFEFECNFDSHVNTFTLGEFLPIFERLINKVRPGRIFIPHPGYNQDHRCVFDSAFTALRPHDKNFFVKKVLVYEAAHDVLWSPRPMNLNYFVPIDIEKKIAAYNLHRSQVRSFRGPEMLRTIAKLRGDMSKNEYAEAFEILRWVDGDCVKERN
jgi:N-acetylglucosamine malate deacetylase 1